MSRFLTWAEPTMPAGVRGVGFFISLQSPIKSLSP